MSINNHLLSLKRKHAFFNKLIEEEQSRPLPDSLALSKLKLRRLKVKEKIAQAA